MGKIALIAHDERKEQMLEFVRSNVDFFRHETVVATGSTGRMLNAQLGRPLSVLLTAPIVGI